MSHQRDILPDSPAVDGGAAEPAATNHPVTVLYLARAAEGVEAFRRFATSYRRHPAGTAHDLVVIYKGFAGEADQEEARAAFAGLTHTALTLPDVAYDLGSYGLAARRITSPFVCCLNTFSEVLADDWLQMMMRHAQRPEVGVVGASCSYEGLTSSLTLLHKASFYQRLCPHHDNVAVHEYFGFLWNCAPVRVSWRQWARTVVGRLVRFIRPFDKPIAPQDVNWKEWLESWLKKYKGPLDYLLTFPHFPNPHVRTNAFVLRRDRLLAWLDPLPETRFDCAGLESGPDGLTRRLLRKGLQPIAVGRDGESYPVEKWPNSGIFRSRMQDNLLVGDNQTREFLAMPPKQRTLYTRMSWGDYLLPEPEDFPKFDATFRLDPSLGGFRAPTVEG